MKKLYHLSLSLIFSGLLLLPASADLYIPPEEELTIAENLPLIIGGILLLAAAALAVIFLIIRKNNK